MGDIQRCFYLQGNAIVILHRGQHCILIGLSGKVSIPLDRGTDEYSVALYIGAALEFPIFSYFSYSDHTLEGISITRVWHN